MGDESERNCEGGLLGVVLGRGGRGRILGSVGDRTGLVLMGGGGGGCRRLVDDAAGARS